MFFSIKMVPDVFFHLIYKYFYANKTMTKVVMILTNIFALHLAKYLIFFYKQTFNKSDTVNFPIWLIIWESFKSNGCSPKCPLSIVHVQCTLVLKGETLKHHHIFQHLHIWENKNVEYISKRLVKYSRNVNRLYKRFPYL